MEIFTAWSNVLAAIKTMYEFSRVANAGNIVHIDLVNHIILIATVEMATLRKQWEGKIFQTKFSFFHSSVNRELRWTTAAIELFLYTKLNFFY